MAIEENHYERKRGCQIDCDEPGHQFGPDGHREVATLHSSGVNADHDIYELNEDGSVQFLRTQRSAMGFGQIHQGDDVLACRCCRHILREI